MNEYNGKFESPYVPDERFYEYLEVATLWSESFRKKRMLKTIKEIRQKEIQNEAKKLKDAIVRNAGCCEVCGFSFIPILQIHHILPISKFGNNVNNIICTCPTCHKTIHYFYNLADSDKGISLERFLDNFSDGADRNLNAVFMSYLKKRCDVYERIENFRPNPSSTK